MPTPPEVVEPGTAQERKPPAETPAVSTQLPATPAPVSAPAPPPPPHLEPAHVGFWARFRKLLAGEPAAGVAEAPAPAHEAVTAAMRGPRREPQREGRREHPRHGRYAESARRERGDGRRGERGDRRGDQARRQERAGERDSVRSAAERTAAERGAGERNIAEQAGAEANRQETGAAAGAPAPPSEARAERPEGRGRGRRGRRRGRRGGGGAREGAVSQGRPDAGAAERESAVGLAAAAQSPLAGNDSHDATPPAHEREPAPREYRAEPGERGAPREPQPVAHFEPQAKPESGAAQNKPYVVWSSAPSEKEGGGRGPDE